MVFFPAPGKYCDSPLQGGSWSKTLVPEMIAKTMKRCSTSSEKQCKKMEKSSVRVLWNNKHPVLWDRGGKKRWHIYARVLQNDTGGDFYFEKQQHAFSFLECAQKNEGCWTGFLLLICQFPLFVHISHFLSCFLLIFQQLIIFSFSAVQDLASTVTTGSASLFFGVVPSFMSFHIFLDFILFYTGRV